ADAASAGVGCAGASDHDCGGGGRRKRDGSFLAAQQVAVALAPRLHRDVSGVGAAGRLGDAQCGDDFAAADRWKERGTLAVVATARDYRADKCGKQQHIRRVEIAASNFLVCDSERYVVESGAA